MNAREVVNSAGYLANETAFSYQPVLGFELGGASVFTGGQNYVGFRNAETITWNTGNFPGPGTHSVSFSPSWNINAVGTFTKNILGIINMIPSVTSTVTMTSMVGVLV